MTNIPISNKTLMCLPIFIGIGLMMLSACQSFIPASVPLQLEHTPGAPITITDNRIDAGWFSLEYPEGWRVVTNEAIAQLRLTLVSPDESLIIYVFDARTNCFFPESTPDPDFYQRRECLGEAAAKLQIEGQVSIDQQAIYAPIFDAVVNSVQFQ